MLKTQKDYRFVSIISFMFIIFMIPADCLNSSFDLFYYMTILFVVGTIVGSLINYINKQSYQ